MDIDGADLRLLVDIRRELHRYPELSLQESRTAAFVAARLHGLGIPVVAGIGGYGLVGSISGAADGPAVALRADMDALPIKESTGLPYASCRPGIMHACGHDGHMAILIGTAAHLARTRRFRGTVHVAFQPAEEGYGGARHMLEDGLLERFPARAIFGLHNWPDLPAGEVVVHDGAVMAGAAEFRLTFSGPPADALRLHPVGDPVLAGAHFVAMVQEAVARRTDPLEAAVVTVASFRSEGGSNGLRAGRTVLTGTFRGMTMQVMAALRDRIGAIAHAAAAIGGVVVDNAFMPEPAAPVVNTLREAQAMRQAAMEAGLSLGPVHTQPSMAAEDFGSFLERIPGAYAWLGNGPSEQYGRLHQPNYDFNDEIIGPGVRLLTGTAERSLA